MILDDTKPSMTPDVRHIMFETNSEGPTRNLTIDETTVFEKKVLGWDKSKRDNHVISSLTK